MPRRVAARWALLASLVVGMVKGDTSHLGERFTDISACRDTGTLVSIASFAGNACTLEKEANEKKKKEKETSYILLEKL